MSIGKEEFAVHCERFAEDGANKRKGWVLKQWEDIGDKERCYTGLGVKDVKITGGLLCDIEVCWHQVYRVPVLCFVAYDEHGGLVRFQQLVDMIRMPEGVSSTAPLLGDQPDAVISQGQHPVTSTFTLHVHPCETHSSLAAMGATPLNAHYLISFLSITGPLLNLPTYLCQPPPARPPSSPPPEDFTIPTME